MLNLTKYTIRKEIEQLVQEEEKGNLHFSSKPKTASIQRVNLLMRVLTEKGIKAVEQTELKNMLDRRVESTILTFTHLSEFDRLEIHSTNDFWIPPKTKLIVMEGCPRFKEIGPLPSHVKGLILRDTAVSDFTNLPPSIEELDIRGMQGRPAWSTFFNRISARKKPLHILGNFTGEKDLNRIPNDVHIVLKGEEEKEKGKTHLINLYISGWYAAKAHEFIYLQDFCLPGTQGDVHQMALPFTRGAHMKTPRPDDIQKTR